jgi:hypothetical protein
MIAPNTTTTTINAASTNKKRYFKTSATVVMHDTSVAILEVEACNTIFVTDSRK